MRPLPLIPGRGDGVRKKDDRAFSGCRKTGLVRCSTSGRNCFTVYGRGDRRTVEPGHTTSHGVHNLTHGSLRTVRGRDDLVTVYSGKDLFRTCRGADRKSGVVNRM